MFDQTAQDASTSSRRLSPSDARASIDELLAEGFQSEAWQRELQRLAHLIGAQHVGYGYANETGLILPFCSTLPMPFLEFYADHSFQAHDPVPQAIIHSSRPLIFDEVARTDAFQEIFVEGGRPHRMQAPSVGVPLGRLHGEQAGVAFYGLEVPTSPEGRERLLAEAERLARDFHRRVTAGIQVY